MRMLDISPDVDEGWQVEQDQARENILFLGLKTFLKEVEFPSLRGG